MSITYKQLLTWIWENPNSNPQDCAEEHDMGAEDIENTLYDLEEEGIVEMVGADHNGSIFSVSDTDASLEDILSEAGNVVVMDDYVAEENKPTSKESKMGSTAAVAEPETQDETTKKAKKKAKKVPAKGKSKTTKKDSSKTEEKPKKKRGRPKGSKNKPKDGKPTTKKKAKKSTSKKDSTPKKRGPGRPKGSKNKPKTDAKPAAQDGKKPRKQIEPRASYVGDWTDPETGKVHKNIHIKKCVDCGQEFPKFTHFKPRWGKQYDGENAPDTAARHVQPRCNALGNNCDAERSKRKQKFIAIQKAVVVEDHEATTISHPKGDGAFRLVEVDDGNYAADLRGSIVILAAAAGLKVIFQTDSPSITGATKKAIKAVDPGKRMLQKLETSKARSAARAQKKAQKAKGTNKKSTKKASTKKTKATKSGTKKKKTAKKAKTSKKTTKKAKTTRKVAKKAKKSQPAKPKRSKEEQEKITAGLKKLGSDTEQDW